MYRADRDCTPVRIMTQLWVYVNPQSEMMYQYQTKNGCYNHCANTAGILVLHKNKSTITQIKDTDPMLLLCWADIVGWTNYGTTQVDRMYWS